MSLPIAVRSTGNRGRWGPSGSRSRTGGAGRTRWWSPLATGLRWIGRALAVCLRWIGRALVRLWRRLSTRTRLWIKVLAALALLVSPIWTLNMAVAFLGRTAIFPLSPYFLREKLTAIGAYARHRVTCSPASHDEVDRLVKQAETRHHLPRALLAAVIQVESNGLAHRISGAGAMGPGQLMPDTAKLLGVDDPFDTAQNVDGAARLLAGHLGRFHKIRLAIAAYHAGPGAVHGHVPNNGITPVYVARVMQTYLRLRPRPPRPRS
ncbi:MAG TPA: lytic transglycosylase domain-containing protein [Polyangia bacterium]|nr:lytic transglycosylase domain-containing protein [Polyangia bacterium]